MPKLPEQYSDALIDIGALAKIPCSKEQNEQYNGYLESKTPLPDSIYSYVPDSSDLYVAADSTTKRFYSIQPKGYTDAEINYMLQLEMIKKTNTIKNCAIFFTVLSILSLLGSLYTIAKLASIMG